MAEDAAEAQETAGHVAALRDHPRVHRRRASLGPGTPERIVSLVPSLSEAIEALGLGDRLVGVTEYCVHPAGAFASLPKVGGTKDADVDAIAGTRPDLVIANQEENTARVVRALAERGIDVWVTYPRTVREGAELLAEIADLGASGEARAACVAPCLAAVERAEARRAAGGPRPSVFCPIWCDPWMTIGRDTYIHDMLALCGGENLFGGADGSREGAAADGPGAIDAVRGRADRRYPIVDLEAVLALDPEVILLPDEPYRFDATDAERLRATDCRAARSGRVHLIDGSLVSWYGPRIAEAIQVLARIFAGTATAG